MRSTSKLQIVFLVVLALMSGSVSVSPQTIRPGFVDPVNDFAVQLTAARSEQERATLLAANKELVTIRLRRVLIQKGNVLLTAGQYAKAFDVYVAAKHVAEQIGDKEGVATAMLDLGTVYYLQANYTSALDHYKQARELFVQAGNNYEAAKALSGVALIYKEQRRNADALKSFHQVLKEFESLNDKEEMANALSSIGTIYYEERKFTEASSAFLKSTELSSTADNTIRIADSFYMQGDYAEASNYYKKSLAGFYEQNNPAGVISALGGAANSAYYLGNYDEALEYFQRNITVQRSQKDDLGLATSFRGAGNVYRSRGDFSRALENYQQGLILAEQIKAPRGTTLGSIGLVRALQGENAQALQYYGKALAEFEETDNKVDKARVSGLIGNVYYAQGNYESALESYRRGLVIREGMDDKPGSADLLSGIGTVNLRMKKYPEALDSYTRAFTLFEAADHKAGAANTLSKIADTYLQQGDHGQAFHFAERASALAKQIENNDLLWHARVLAGKAQRGLDQPAQALQSFIEAIAIVESLRTRPAASEAGAERSGVLPYLAAVDLLVAQNRAAEAFTYAERAKVQSLIELLRRSNSQSVKSMSAAEQAEERKLAGSAVSLELQLERESLSRTSTANRRAAMRDRLNQARSDYADFRGRLYLAHPSVKVERGELAMLKPEQLRPLLSDGRTALLEYVITENNVYLFALTVDDANKKIGGKRTRAGMVTALKVYPLSVSREALAQGVAAFSQLLSKRDESFHPLGRELYDALIRPAEEQLSGKTKFVIVPEGSLWRLPFEALQPADDGYLLDQAAISYAPSLSTLREMLKQRRPANPTGPLALIAFANPQLSKELLQRLELTYKNENFELSPVEENEIQRLRTVYGEAQSHSFTGPNASEERVKLEAARAGVLHFATPALLDDISPMYSFIALSSPSENNANDGVLQTREIINLDTPARMVVLSASRFRNDATATGAAPIALAWSWFVAGSPSTVFSRWQVNSPGTTQMMAEFHSRLRSRKSNSKANALQQSALALRRSTDYRHPHYWAAFSVIGDAR
ncbi:MAG TPA: tetratricopeptide repeat protein [Pyrinomonadaceae bacterium]|nr:tetratricopeptide repeat protein [Pyrinomonadaceae bacterium]